HLTPTLSPQAGRGRPKAKPGAAEGHSSKPAEAKPQIAQARRDGSIDFAEVRLTNPGRVLYPGQGITKLALAEFYAAIADWALPHIVNRPLTLVRCPEGYGKECFYQKHLGSGVPEVIGSVEIPEKKGSETYPVIDDL